jgi:hypothetical protein
VTDLARARAFYEALGWTGARQPDDEVCFFQAGGMVFGLWTALGGHGAPGIELAHNVRSSEEVSIVLDEAERAGGTIKRHAAPPPNGRDDRRVRRSGRLRLGSRPQPRLVPRRARSGHALGPGLSRAEDRSVRRRPSRLHRAILRLDTRRR